MNRPEPTAAASGRVVICGAQVPFVRGGSEVLYDSLRGELARRGHAVDVVTLPFSDRTRLALFKSAFAWRMVDVELSEGRPVDLAIATRFPSYLVRHPNKVVWLVHQHRQCYDLLGTPFSDFATTGADARWLELMRGMDRRALGEARGLFAISRNTAERLKRALGLEAEVLYPPPKLGDAYRAAAHGDFALAVGRLDPMKRFDLLVRAIAHTQRPLRAVIAGEGTEKERLRSLAGELGVGERLDLPGRVSDAELLRLYSEALAVVYAPHDEDYGYVTVEALRSQRPVVTTEDAGGVLEFVDHEVTGLVAEAGSARAIARELDRLWADRALAARLGERGRERVRDVTWGRVISRLTARS